MSTKRVDYYCKHCGSRDVTADANARWNISRQCWELAGEPDTRNAICTECDGEAILKEIKLPGVRHAR